MKANHFLTLAAMLCLSLFFSCTTTIEPLPPSQNGGGDGEKNISGFSQKGPFVKGSSITLFELDSNLVQTGKSFQNTIEDDKGSFEINGITLVSPYVRLKVDGYYYNEVSGKKSVSPITLYAIADLTSKNKLNVNLLTHLEHEKVQKLVEAGESFSKAKKQAQQDILKAFGIGGEFANNSEDMSIFGSSEGSAVLLAISILFQGEREEASFTDLLADFKQSIKNSSEWSNAKKTELADWASGADFEKIRANINGWGLHYEVPIFEKYVRKYWSDNYGLGECKPANNGYVAKNANPLSVNKSRSYVCNGNYWELFVEGEKSSSSSVLSSSSVVASPSSSSVVVSSSSVSVPSSSSYFSSNSGNNYMVCAATPAMAGEGDFLNISCPSGVIVDIAFASYGTAEGSCGNFAIGECHADNSLSVVSSACIGKTSCNVFSHNETFGDPCDGTPKNLSVQAVCSSTEKISSSSSKNNSSSSIAIAGETFMDNRDGKIYKLVKIGEQVWMAENLSYEIEGSKCYDNKNANCDIYGRLYNLEMAIESCPEGWHLPTMSEWDVLIEKVGGYSIAGRLLKAKNYGGSDMYGFTAMLGGYGYADGGFKDFGYSSLWWNSTNRNASDIGCKSMFSTDDRVLEYAKHRSNLLNVRCVRDYNTFNKEFL